MKGINTMVWIQFTALFFNFIGTILFARTVIKSKKEIAKLSGGIPSLVQDKVSQEKKFLIKIELLE